MKRITCLLIFSLTFLFSTNMYAQSPDLFNYQGVARTSSGSSIQNQAVGLRVTIRETSSTGNIVYQETQQPTTNQFGLFNIKIGNGTVVSGSMASIAWGANTHFMEVEMDETGGTNYQAMGVQQLISVPYAKHAGTVENDEINDADADPTNELQVLSINADTLFISNGNFVVLSFTNTDNQNLTFQNDSVLIEDGTGVDLSGYLDNTDNQNLTFQNDSILIEDGIGVDLSGYLDTDDQSINLQNDSILIEDGTGVDLSGYLDNTDNQNLTFQNDSILIDNGVGVDLSGYLDTDDQSLNLQNDSILIEDGTGVDLSGYLDNTDNQNLTFQNDSILIEGGIGVDLSGYLGSDDQSLTLQNDSILIEDGTGVDLSGYLDNTDNQNLTLQNDSILIDSAVGVDLSGYLDNTDDQTLTLQNDTIYIEDGNYVTLSDNDASNELQNLSIVGDTISISNGNSIVIPSGIDGVDGQDGADGAGINGFAVFEEQQPSATDAGGFTSGSWVTRVLNTDAVIDGSSISRTGNVLTLDSGTYYVSAIVPAYQVDAHQAKLQNTTTATTALLGNTAVEGFSIIKGFVTVTSTSTFEVQHRCSTTKATDGLGKGAAFGENNIYTRICIIQVNTSNTGGGGSGGSLIYTVRGF